MNRARLIWIAILGLAVSLGAADAAEAASPPSDPMQLIPAASPSYAQAGRLARHSAPPTWQQLTPPAPATKPTAEPATRARPRVGAFSCVPCCDPCVRWTFSLPVWIPGVRTEVSNGSVSVDGDRDPSDLVDSEIISEIQFAFVGAITARKGRWGAGIDFLTATIDSTADFSISDGLITAAASGRIRATMGRIRFDYLYSRALLPWKLERCGCAEHRVHVGARFYDVAVSAQASRIQALSLDIGEFWVDPIVGLQSDIPFARNFSLLLAADVGGFGIDSDWSWSALAGVQWRFARRWSATLAYNLLDFRRVTNVKSERTVLDLHLSGPQLAVSFYL